MGSGRAAAGLVLLFALAFASPSFAQVGVDVSVDPLAIGNAIDGAISSAADRAACVKAAAEAGSAATDLNVMVFNLQQGYQFSASNDDIKYFEPITCDGITFGVWAFCSGTFTNEGDGGFINWAFRGSFIRDPPDSSTVVFDNVC